MKRIVILRCLRSNNVCTGAACMRAFNTKSGAFARYGEEPLELEAYWSCNGCGDCRFEHQAGIEEKLERIIGLKPDAVHVGVCVKPRTQDVQVVTCNTIEEICESLEAAGLWRYLDLQNTRPTMKPKLWRYIVVLAGVIIPIIRQC